MSSRSFLGGLAIKYDACVVLGVILLGDLVLSPIWTATKNSVNVTQHPSGISKYFICIPDSRHLLQNTLASIGCIVHKRQVSYFVGKVRHTNSKYFPFAVSSKTKGIDTPLHTASDSLLG